MSTPYQTAVLGTVGLANYYELDETTGTTASDAVGGNNLTYVGSGLTLGNYGIDGSDCPSTTGASGIAYGGPVAIDSTTGYSYLGSMSIEAWYKCSDLTHAAQIIFMNGSTPNNNGYGLAVNSSSVTGNFAILVSRTEWKDTGIAVPTGGGWHHVVLLVDWSGATGSDSTNWVGLKYTLYLDGSSVWNYTESGSTYGGVNTFFIGSDGGSSLFFGEIDEVAVYTTLLSSGTISTHYSDGASATTHSVSGSTTITFGYTASEVDIGDKSVSGSTTLTFSYVASIPRTWNCAASTAITLSYTASDADPTTWAVSASTSLWLSVAAKSARYLAVSASSYCLLYGQDGGTYKSPIPLSYVDDIAFSGVASCHAVGNKPVSASTILTFSQVGSESENINWVVGAAHTLTFSGSASYKWNTHWSVAAGTSIALADVGSEIAHRNWVVSGSTPIVFSGAATYSHLAVYYVSAQSSLAIVQSASEAANHVVSGSSAFNISSASQQNRAFGVAATTTITLSYTPKINDFWPVAGLNALTFSYVAAAAIGYTGAGNSLRFIDLAQAVVWIPWRRAPLTLLPGGNLPHS